jgi:hypothetical protein
MYFLVDSKAQTVVCAAKKLGELARQLLQMQGVEVPPSGDPVKLARAVCGERFAMLNLSAAFESIKLSDDSAAQELAGQFQQAIDNIYTEL